jgi:hypothetical protein
MHHVDVGGLEQPVLVDVDPVEAVRLEQPPDCRDAPVGVVDLRDHGTDPRPVLGAHAVQDVELRPLDATRKRCSVIA